MCSPDIIRHVIGALGPADHAGGGAAQQPAEPTETNSKNTCFSDVCDLTHPLPETFPSASGEQWLELQNFLTFAERGINFGRWLLHEHIGTHIDAPIHFSEDGATVDEISVSALVVPLVVLDIRGRAAKNSDTQLTPEYVFAWEARHGEIPNGCSRRNEFRLGRSCRRRRLPKRGS